VRNKRELEQLESRFDPTSLSHVVVEKNREVALSLLMATFSATCLRSCRIFEVSGFVVLGEFLICCYNVILHQATFAEGFLADLPPGSTSSLSQKGP